MKVALALGNKKLCRIQWTSESTHGFRTAAGACGDGTSGLHGSNVGPYVHCRFHKQEIVQCHIFLVLSYKCTS